MCSQNDLVKLDYLSKALTIILCLIDQRLILVVHAK